MKIKYLGTAAAEGWPGLFCHCKYCEKARKLGGKNLRTRSQVVIDDVLLVDFPPDTYAHVLYQNLNLQDIRTLIITHSHQDHFYPLDLEMRGVPYSYGTENYKLSIYGNDKVKKIFDRAMGSSDLSIKGKNIECNQVKEYEPFETGGYTITPLLAAHDRKEKCLIYIIEKDGKRMLYSNDTGLYPDETWDYIKGTYFDLISFESTCLIEKEGANHMGLEDNRIAKERLIQLGCVDDTTKFVITHFSHNGKLMHHEIEEAVKEDRFYVAYDGYVIEI